MLRNRGGRPRQKPAPQPTSPRFILPKPGAGQVPPLARPNQASATAFLANQTPFSGLPPTTTSPLHRITSHSSQRRLEPYSRPLGFADTAAPRLHGTSHQDQQRPQPNIQSIASDPPGAGSLGIMAPWLLDPAPHPSQRRLEPYSRPLGFADTAAPRLHGTSHQGQQRPRPNIQSIASEPPGAGSPGIMAPWLLDPAPHPIQRLPDNDTQPLISELRSDIVPEGPATSVLIGIVTEWGLQEMHMASFDDSHPLNSVTRSTVDIFDLAEKPCEDIWIRTPRGARRCSRIAVFSCTFPNEPPLLEISQTPQQVEMYIIEELDVTPLIHFGKPFRDDIRASFYGDNLIQPRLSPDMASHHSMRQPFQEPYVQGSQSVPHNPQSTARALVVDVGTTEDSLANLSSLHTTMAADSQYEHWRIDDWNVEDWDIEELMPSK